MRAKSGTVAIVTNKSFTAYKNLSLFLGFLTGNNHKCWFAVNNRERIPGIINSNPYLILSRKGKKALLDITCSNIAGKRKTSKFHNSRNAIKTPLKIMKIITLCIPSINNNRPVKKITNLNSLIKFKDVYQAKGRILRFSIAGKKKCKISKPGKNILIRI